jgi:hypothetical protein
LTVSLRAKVSKFFEQRWQRAFLDFYLRTERLCWRVLFPANQGRAACYPKYPCWL